MSSSNAPPTGAKPSATSPKPRSPSKSSTASPAPKPTSANSRTRSPKSMVSTRSSSSKRSPSPKQSRSQRSAKPGDESGGELNGIEQSIAPLTDRPENLVDSIIEEVQEKPEPITGYVKDLVQLTDLSDELWNETHDTKIDEFLTKSDKKLLVFYIDSYEVPGDDEARSRLVVQNEMPTNPTDQFAYFIKSHYSEEINTKELFNKYVQYGTFGGKHLLSLLRLTSGLYAPLFFGNKTWPDTIKNDFSAQLHRFLASLTDTTWKMEGVTVLYIPKEGLDQNPEVAAKNKELVQRLETAVIYWSRQLKDVLNSQDMSGLDETAGPLEEIDFWKARNRDLMGISKQLNKPSIKKITHILDLAKSSYVASFLKLAKQIQDGSKQAENNLQFLLVLKDPCHELADAKPAEIGRLLPRIINIIRVIWNNSEFYNTRERLTAMFRKLSNEVIRRCCASINLDHIFDGAITSSKKSLNESIECCTSWKDLYANAVKVHERFSKKGWELDRTTIFAQIDAFIQRCRDLIDICDCQVHFANWEDGEKKELPVFGGQKGPEISRNLSEIESTFNRHLMDLRRVKNSILDVKATTWHEDYNKFRSAVKEMEVMIINVINAAFDTVTYVEQGVEILDAFMHLSARESIRRTIDKKTVDIYQLFMEDLNTAKREITSRAATIDRMHPQYAGAALWAKGLKRRIEKQMLVLNMAHFLPSAGVGDEARVQYKHTSHALDEFMRKCFNEWTFSLENEPMKLLELPLLRKSAEVDGMIDVNLSGKLLKLLMEVHYWERLGFEIPHYCADAFLRKDEIRNTRENVLTIVLDYNRIIASLSFDERRLFKERIKILDKRIQPGFNKLTWAKAQAAEEFITGSRRHASELQTVVDKYKASLTDCFRFTKQISECLLVRIDSRKIFENLEFQDDQSRHRRSAAGKLSELYDLIESTLKSTQDIFKKDESEDVRSQWAKLIDRMHRMLEEAFRLNVKNSLLELSKSINGDGKSAPNPLFKVSVILEPYEENLPAKFTDGEAASLVAATNTTKYRVNFSPTLEQLAHLVNSIGQHHLTDSISSITKSKHDIFPKNKTPIYLNISRDEDKVKIEKQISAGMENNARQLEEYLTRWQNFRELWEVNKDNFLLRYEQRNPAVAKFDGDIARYTEVENSIQNQEAIETIQFILLDCSPLKLALLSNCQEWQNKFTALLLKLGTQTLLKLIADFDENSTKVMVPPETHYDLDASNKLLERLQNNLPVIEEQFGPLADQFNLLQKYEVSIPHETSETLKSLNKRWEDYKQTLLNAEEMLKKYKDRFKTKLLQQSEEFKKSVNELVNEFKTKGPFSADIKPEEALAQIEAIKARMSKLKEEEQELRRGLGIFRIDQPLSKDIQNLEKDVEAIQQVWLLVQDWDLNYNGWKSSLFSKLETRDMDDYAQAQFKRLVKMSRDLREKNWEIVDVTKNRVDRFKRTMPLVNDLHNKAMRERHWNQIKEESNKQFDENGEQFTLEAIIDMHFEENATLINEVSEAASKEFEIEKGLRAINSKWEITQFETGPLKEKEKEKEGGAGGREAGAAAAAAKDKEKTHAKIKSADDVNKAIEEDQVMLSTYKASRFVKPFATEVDRWERDISHILEITEALLSVQKLWLYLENIFAGEDIRSQMPKETVEFESLNAAWRAIIARIVKDPNAYRATHHEGLDKQLADMNARFEELQKSLESYLETKKIIFPRFYFISNDDLLEILGQNKNPAAVQPHLKKLFDNIKSLRLQKSSIGNKFEALSMFSSEGEEVPFQAPLVLDGPVESWLCDVEYTMRTTLREQLKKCRQELKKNLNKRDKWIKDQVGQLCITASQIQWTQDCTKALIAVKTRQDKKPLKSLKKKQTHMLNKFSEIIRSANLNKMQRSKIVALVTIEIHARDVIEKLAKSNCTNENGFEWLMQLRVYWDKDKDDCVIRQTTTEFNYGYEYLGNSGRLVITPLTDRCYMTLTTALQNNRGGSPKGPAGTGKTETVKDLGKSLGMYVIVINCSEGLDYQSMGRMFSGLAQTGAWGCFDEFNRINIEVLSVVAQQILSIIDALSNRAPKCVIERSEVKLVPSCGIFITMNPGYAGRTELPDNLKSMFRPISMCVPDSNYIAEIILFGEGFNNTRLLAKKVYTLYQLSMQQLSKQDHYDFGLRALSSVLRHAGKKKRANPTMSDEEILLLAMKDMNVPKMTAVDLPLFNGIVSDLFPGVEPPQIDYSKFKKAIQEELRAENLQVNANAVTKVIQLYETKNSRHSVMLVGRTQSGKTVTWQMLKKSMTRLNKEGDPEFQKVQEYTINPKAVSLGELYGEFDLSTNEWSDGILSAVMRKSCADPNPDEKWVFFDSPVDAVWIESMNSVMDDNKILTLINSERIAMPEQVSLLFETEDLAVASPATVSRCGMVYCDYVDLGWNSHIDSWIGSKKQKELQEELRALITKYIKPILNFKRLNCKELVPIAELNGIKSMCNLFDAFGTKENGIDPQGEEFFGRMCEMWFLFCVIWSIGASVDEDGRKRLDAYIRELEGTFPNKDTVYEYYVDTKQRAWVQWEEKLRTGWKYNPEIPFYKIIVPTVDTVRYNFIVSGLIRNQRAVLLTGPVGTGKTSVAQSVLSELDPLEYTVLVINMSAQTSSNNVQEIIESKIEKRTKGVFVPFGGKKMLNFMDDFNMPAKDVYGSQPPLELIRLWLDFGFWYDRKKQTEKFIKDVFLMAAMGPPGGGRTVISKRLQSRFNLINMTFPSESEINRIFGSMINQKLQEFDDEFKSLGDIMTKATIEIYESVIKKFLPTPTKIHYLFNLRDISKVFQGLLRCDKRLCASKQTLIRLWIHESFRVFCDRLVDDKDRESFIAILSENLGAHFDQTYHNICANKQPPVFADFMNPDQIYEDLLEFPKLKNQMERTLLEYNEYPGQVPMDIVLFKDAIEHVCRVVRVIRQPRGNMLLIGIGGSGRQSLSKLASFICLYTVFQIEVSKNYRRGEFREDIKKLYGQAGINNKETTFIFTDTQIVDEAFLEDINNILSSGEVPNLYKPEEMEEIKNNLEKEAKKNGIEENPQAIYNFLLDRVKANLHVIVCMSPVGEVFRNRIRMYPALVNCTTIDLFNEWPQEALLEVGERYLASVDLDKNEQCRSALAEMFAIMHKSVSDESKKMFLEIRRNNYVTPTNFLELTSGYKKLLYEKRKELGDSANKLTSGLSKIIDTRVKVEQMSVQLEENKAKAAKFQKECEDYLVVLVGQKREADEQAKSVAAFQVKIQEEEAKCLVIAEAAQKDLDEAMPALNEAMKALESLNKRDIAEVRAYGRPPQLVEIVMEAVMILKQSEPSWNEAKRQLGDANFIKSLTEFDRDNIPDKVLKRINKYTSDPDFEPEKVGSVSGAAKSLCMWVRAMELYGKIFRVVQPKRERYNQAMSQLKEKQDALADAKKKLDDIQKQIEDLKKQYDEKMVEKEKLTREIAFMEMMLDRATRLISGLAGERTRWEETVKDLETQMGFLVGDCLLAAAFLSYMGPFLSQYREEIMDKIWLAQVRRLNIPCNPEFNFSSFLSKPTQVREWNILGLPTDLFSTENGVIVTRGSRWPLMVDPQAQAIKWVKNMEKKHNLTVFDLQTPDYMRLLEMCIQLGRPCLCQNVKEDLDPSLNPVLNKSAKKIGGVWYIKLGDRDVEYNKNFRMYMTTKLSNPNYAPEVSSKANIINFAVKEQGLEAQLLGIVVRNEKAELEDQKDSLVLSIAGGKNKLVELEDQILKLLNETKGSLLDNVELVDTLEVSKQTSKEVTEAVQNAEQTEIKIDAAREGYRPCAQRAAILFFVLNDLGKVDPMYQFSLDAYISLFNLSIEKSQKSSKLEERIDRLNDYHTYAVYKSTCRALFEVHKLLFSFQMCVKILEAAGKLNMDEYQFFLKGGVVLDRENQMDNPCSLWLADQLWDNITELSKLANFHGIIESFEQYPRDWHAWFQSAEPEKAPLPGEWDSSLNELQRMLLVRSLRPDRVSSCAYKFIVNNLGSKFVEPPVLDIKSVWDDSTCRTPLIFVLSPGVDPNKYLKELAEKCNMTARFNSLSLGQGQSVAATKRIREGAKAGNWVFLANCHLSLSWMPTLDKIVEQLQTESVHKDFRLWLSSSPNPDFPIAILQSSIKITTEPPKGIKANTKRLYAQMTDAKFNACKKPEKYKKLLFCLCFFHSILLERKKFLNLGWNVNYSFNDSDFDMSEKILVNYLDMYDETQWDALKYLIALVNYGGHVTDDWDMRLLQTYMNGLFKEEALQPFFKLSVLPHYYVPKDGTLQSYREFVNMMPNTDHPEAFGQHPNADIASQIKETRMLFDTLLSLQPQVTGGGGGGASNKNKRSTEEEVMELSTKVLDSLPQKIDYEGTLKIFSEDNSPLKIVLLQEIERYNILLDDIYQSLIALQKGIQGLVVMSSDLDEIFKCIFEARVPTSWQKMYPSMKPLAAWTRDLVQRVEQLAKWSETAHPPVIFWMSGFTYPTGFLTAVLQTSARQYNISVDSLSWDFTVQQADDQYLTTAPKDGVYIRGLFLEAAAWDKKAGCLIDPEPMQLVCAMPTILFKPVENKKKVTKGVYNCPCYVYPNRAVGSGRPSFVVAVDLKTGAMTSDHFVKRGTALLMSLDY